MFPIRPILDQLSLLGARVLGQLIGRPSDGLLTRLAARDRGARPSTLDDSPMVAASHHIQLGQSAFSAAAYGEALHHFGVALSHAPDAPWAWPPGRRREEKGESRMVEEKGGGRMKKGGRQEKQRRSREVGRTSGVTVGT